MSAVTTAGARPLRWSAASLCVIVLAAGCSHGARAQLLLQQYLPDVAQPIIGQNGFALAPDITATQRETFDTQPNTTVLTRPHPDYDNYGIHVGDFYIRPQYTQSTGYNSNLFADRSGRGAFLLNESPSVAFASDWAGKSLYGGVLVSNTIYPTQLAQGFTDYTVNLGGSYDVGQDQLRFTLTHGNEHIARGSVDSGQFDTPIPFLSDNAHLSYRAQFARLSFEPAIDFFNTRFSNGTLLGQPLIETVNTNDAVQGKLTTRYELSPHRDLVLVTQAVTQNFYFRQPLQPSRNARTLEVLGGIDFAVNALIRVRALAGYEQRYFTSSAFGSRSAPVINLDVTWSPTQLTTLTASANRSIEDGLTIGTTGFTYTELKLGVDHELYRNIIISGHALTEIANFSQNQGSQEIYNVGASANWRVNRNVTLGARYDYSYNQSSAAIGPTFYQNLVLLSLGFQL